MNKNNNYLSLFFVALLSFALTSCSSSKSTRPTDNSKPIVDAAKERLETVNNDKSQEEGKTYFAFDSYVLDVQKNAKDLSNMLSDIKSSNVQYIEVVGHADERGSDEYNYDLALKRANAIKEYLKNNSNLSSSKITTASRGKTQPVVLNATSEKDHAKNRRVEVTLYIRD